MSAFVALAVVVAGSRAARAHIIDVPEDYPTIQAAVDAAGNGDRIRVAPGTYHESIVWTGKAIALIGAGPDASILDPSPDPGGRCLTLVDVSHGSRVEGFTCQNGMTDATSPDGGGMLMQGGSLQVKRVIFRNNSAFGNGGGVWIDGGDVTVHDASFLANEAALAGGGQGGGLGITGGSRVRLVRALFSGNFTNPSGGGLAVLDGSSAWVIESRFEANFGRSGGGIWSADSELRVSGSVFFNHGIDFGGAAIGAGNSSVEVADSTIDSNSSERREHAINVSGRLAMLRSSVTGNLGGGIASLGDLTVRDCSFANNTSKTGGAINATGTARVTNSVFLANTADGVGGLGEIEALGGAIYADGDVSVTHCTFYGNRAEGYVPPDDGGGIYLFSGSTTVLNSILWGDSPNEIAGPGTASITYSDVMGGYPGTGNIDQDPLFIDPAAGDLHLQVCSPARDAGLFTSSLPPTDLDGNRRVAGAAPDMGAYEIRRGRRGR
ncbi:right-handed parallel beta-helix repeat-containing protein [Sorangium sp. So ce1014]|uniref:right-handed parallel beta-helix repeat-containing protein n=1 Tax=Sorangium sp. So ce1014 TaxID=3133326 RepID=UPI003F63C7E3